MTPQSTPTPPTATTRKRRPTTPFYQVENIRKRLQLEPGEFAEAIGLSNVSSYRTAARNGVIGRAYALAAEALMRRQARDASADYRFLVTVVRGVPSIVPLAGLDELTIKGTTYLLIPKP